MRKSQLSTRQLLAGIENDDQRIIDTFYVHLYAKAQAVLCRQVGPGSREDLAFEDCFSSAFLTIIKKVREGIYREGNFQAFAIGVVKNCYRSALRKMRRQAWTDLEDVPEFPEVTPYHIPDAKTCFTELDHPRLWIWFIQLEPAEKQLLDYRIQGYQHDEIAPLVGLAPGTVRNRFAGLVKSAKCIVGERGKSAA
ncbi:MAG: hypothetical protein DHS20C18_40830 [Saprospiraceae bacterium]|nr:MAG: hypothetical protein DHS20C18_40830 [Saprospiraceae bacterium]